MNHVETLNLVKSSLEPQLQQLQHRELSSDVMANRTSLECNLCARDHMVTAETKGQQAHLPFLVVEGSGPTLLGCD